MFSHHQQDYNSNESTLPKKKRKRIKYVYVMPGKKAPEEKKEPAAVEVSQEQLAVLISHMAANPPVKASEEKEVVTQGDLKNTGQFAATMAESLGNFQNQVGQSMLGFQQKMEHSRALQVMFDQESFKFLHNGFEANV